MTRNKKFITAIYCILSVIKWFTARIDFQTEEGPVIIAKLYPTSQNIFYGSDRSIAQYSQQYIWYKEKLYVDLLYAHNFVWLYDALIYIWWLATILLGIYFLIKLLRIIYMRFFLFRNI